jgi:hypothetical protein
MPHVDRTKWWLEPACGNGAIERLLVEEFGISKVIATDIAPGPRYAGGFEYVHERDYLSEKYAVDADGIAVTFMRYEVAITNPPYSLAFEFVQRMTQDARVAVALLPLTFLGSAKRQKWLREHPPNLYVLSDRPSFCNSFKCAQGRTPHTSFNLNGPDGCGWSEQLPPDQGVTACPDCGGKVRKSSTDAIDYFWGVWGLPAQPIQFLGKEDGAP